MFTLTAPFVPRSLSHMFTPGRLPRESESTKSNLQVEPSAPLLLVISLNSYIVELAVLPSPVTEIYSLPMSEPLPVEYTTAHKFAGTLVYCDFIFPQPRPKLLLGEFAPPISSVSRGAVVPMPRLPPKSD